jgi:hypothetical protein
MKLDKPDVCLIMDDYGDKRYRYGCKSCKLLKYCDATKVFKRNILGDLFDYLRII